MIDFSKVPELLGERGVWVKPTVTDAQLAMVHRDLRRRLATPFRLRLDLRTLAASETGLVLLKRQRRDAVVIEPGNDGDDCPQAVHSREGTTGL